MIIRPAQTGLIKFHRVCLFISLFQSFNARPFYFSAPRGAVSEPFFSKCGHSQHLLANVSYIVYFLLRALPNFYLPLKKSKKLDR